MNNKKFKLIIIGSGPAGYTSSIYAARSGLKPILYKGNISGGQLTTTTYVENYPGYKKISGIDLMLNFQNQSKNFGVVIKKGFINLVDFSVYPYKLLINSNFVFSNSIIVATGASHRLLGIKYEDKVTGLGLSYCAICDGYFFKNKDVIVVGGGDSALEQSFYLSNICNKVYLVVRKNKMRASYIMQKKLIPN